MGSGLRHSARALGAVLALLAGLAALGATGATSPAGAASSTADAALARAGLFETSDLPASYEPSARSDRSHADNARLAKGVDGCGPYVTLQKSLLTLPQARSASFSDGVRTLANEVDVFPSDRAASAALALYAKSSVVGCLENLFEKQTRQSPDLSDQVDDVVVTLDRQDISGLGDERVVYEGSVVMTGTDGSSVQIGIGNAVVRIGRTVDVVTYSTTGDGLTDVLAPAIDDSVARLRAAIPRSGS